MEQTAKERARRLGAVIKKLRKDRGFTLDKLADKTELSKSFLSYLEKGEKYADIGVDNLARLLKALGAPADSVLQKAGYLSEVSGRQADLRTQLQEHLGLPQTDLEHAMSYLEYLANKNRSQRARAKEKKK